MSRLSRSEIHMVHRIGYRHGDVEKAREYIEAMLAYWFTRTNFIWP
jgi:hypothetical protein